MINSADTFRTVHQANLNALKSFVNLFSTELDENNMEMKAHLAEETAKTLEKFNKYKSDFELWSNCLKKTEISLNVNLNSNYDYTTNKDRLFEKINDALQNMSNIRRPGQQNGGGCGDALSAANEEQIASHLEAVRDILDEFHPLRVVADETDEEAAAAARITQMLDEARETGLRELRNAETREPFEDADGDADYGAERGPTAAEVDDTERKRCEQRVKKRWSQYVAERVPKQQRDAMTVFEDFLSHSSSSPVFDHEISALRSEISDIISSHNADIVMIKHTQNYIDPIMKTLIRTPMSNLKCGHIYEKDSVMALMKNKSEIPCPCVGCDCIFTLNDLQANEKLLTEIQASFSSGPDIVNIPSSSVEQISIDDSQEINRVPLREDDIETDDDDDDDEEL